MAVFGFEWLALLRYGRPFPGLVAGPPRVVPGALERRARPAVKQGLLTLLKRLS